MFLLFLGSVGTINTRGDLPQVFDESTKTLQEKLRDGGLPNPIGLLSTHIPSQAIVRANRKVQAQSGAIVQHWGSYNR